jgi:prepilin peptidase CpaA
LNSVVRYMLAPVLMQFSAQVVTDVAVAVAVAAAVIDTRSRRIPNRLTYSAMIAGMVLQSALFGWRGLISSVAGGLVFGGVFLLFYMVRAMGAGDVKLAAALGCVIGLAETPRVLIATALCGGVFALLRMMLSGKILATIRSTFSVLWFHANRGVNMHPTVNLDNPKADRMPYGIAFAAGTIYWAASSIFWR